MWLSTLWPKVLIFIRYPFKLQTTFHHLMKLNLFSWQPFSEFYVRQINSEGKNKCSLSAAFFFFFWTGFSVQDWNHLCGVTAQRTQTSEGERTQQSQEKPPGALKRHPPEATHTYISFHYAWSYWRSLQWLMGDLFTWILLQTLTTFGVRQSGVWC